MGGSGDASSIFISCSWEKHRNNMHVLFVWRCTYITGMRTFKSQEFSQLAHTWVIAASPFFFTASDVFPPCTCSQTLKHTSGPTRTVRQVHGYLHNEAGQVSKGTALPTGVKRGLRIWQRNRAVNSAAGLTSALAIIQTSKLHGDQRGQ